MPKKSTPWGLAQDEHEIAPGIVRYYTASHGGIHLSPERQAELANKFAFQTWARGPWYEEDEDVAAVVIAFPEFFTPEQLMGAVKSAHLGRSRDPRWADVNRYLNDEGRDLSIQALRHARATAGDWRVVSLSSAGHLWHVTVRRGRDQRYSFDLVNYPTVMVLSDEEVEQRKRGILGPEDPAGEVVEEGPQTTGANPEWSPPPGERIRIPGAPKRKAGPQLPGRAPWQLGPEWLPIQGRNTRLNYQAVHADGDKETGYAVFRGEYGPYDADRLRAVLTGYTGEVFDPRGWGVPDLSGEGGFVVHELLGIDLTDEPPTDPRPWRQFVEFVEQQAAAEDDEDLVCAECGYPMFVDPSGVSHHLSPEGDIDYDLDADHVAVPDVEPGTLGARPVSGHFPFEGTYHPVQVVPVEQLVITKDAPELHEELIPPIMDMLAHDWNLRVVPPVMVAEGIVNGRDVYQVLDGHHRLEAAERLGYEEVPVVNRLAMRRGDLAAHGRRVAAYRRLLGHPLAFGTTGARKKSPLWNEGDNKAADAVIFRERAGQLEVLLGKRRRDNQWALLGGFVDKGESRETAARREAKEEAGINLQRKHLVGETRVFGGKGTGYDPRDADDRWVTTQAFVYAVPPQLEPRCVQDVDAGIVDARFVPYKLATRRKLYAGHNEVLEAAFKVLRTALKAQA